MFGFTQVDYDNHFGVKIFYGCLITPLLLAFLGIFIFFETALAKSPKQDINYTCISNIPFSNDQLSYDFLVDVPNILVLRVDYNNTDILEYKFNQNCIFKEINVSEISKILKATTTLKEKIGKKYSPNYISMKYRFEKEEFAADYEISISPHVSDFVDPGDQLYKAVDLYGPISETANQWLLYAQKPRGIQTGGITDAGFSAIPEKPAHIVCFEKDQSDPQGRCKMEFYFKRYRVDISMASHQMLEHWPAIWQQVVDKLEDMIVLYVWDNRCEGSFCAEFTEVLEGSNE